MPGNRVQRQEDERQRGERLIAEMLTLHHWKEKALLAERKGHPVKVAIAMRLRSSTAWTQQQIAERLRMGTRTYLNYLLHHMR